MLVLSRKEQENVIIGDPENPIGTVTVISIVGNKVRLGFKFNSDIQINREEIANEIRKEVKNAVRI